MIAFLHYKDGTFEQIEIARAKDRLEIVKPCFTLTALDREFLAKHRIQPFEAVFDFVLDGYADSIPHYREL
jgi:hypothetical protein